MDNHFTNWVKGFLLPKKEKKTKEDRKCSKCNGSGVIFKKYVRLDIVDPEFPISNNITKRCPKCKGTGLI